MIRRAALQAGRLGVEGIDGDALHLGPGQYRAVLHVRGLSFSLLGEEEQEALFAAYFHWLKALSYPIQLLVRVLPLDLQGYLDTLEWRAGRQSSPALAALTRDHMTFLQRLARERTLLERHLYVVVPSGDGDGAAGGRFGRRRDAPAREAALAQLTARCEDVAAGLRTCRLTARRLTAAELLALLSGCWRPERAPWQPFAPEHLVAQLAVRGSRHAGRSA